MLRLLTRPHAPRNTFRLCALGASAALCVFLSVCYAFQPDWSATVTIWPVWAWLFPAVVLQAAGQNRRTKRVAYSVALLWIAYLAIFAEEPRSMARGFLAAIGQGAGPCDLRVVTLNCAVGTAAAAREVCALDPDVVLLQESPGRRDVNKLKRQLFGRGGVAVYGLNCSIVARAGRSESSPITQMGFLTALRLKQADGRNVEVVSLHLYPPITRMDLWRPDCWQSWQRNRQVRLQEMDQVAAFLQTIPPDVPVILGGDFNAPALDAVYRCLPPRLMDTFRMAGRGWGNTAINDFPIIRIDQIWASRGFTPKAVWARKTVHSDHRMVVCDMDVRR